MELRVESVMRKLIDIIEAEIQMGFQEAGYEQQYAKVMLSSRPDLCEYQCNGAMPLAKLHKKAPLVIANEIVKYLANSERIEDVEAVAPGFLNFNLKKDFLVHYLEKMAQDEHLGVEQAKNPKTIILDYGGPNVAKPLHVGHLRSAVIGESLKRITRYMGHKAISDIHLGDWGYQMGLIITELNVRQPKLPYFDETFAGEYPKEAPFTIGELEEIYPTASGKAKEDEAYREAALQATFLLQNGHIGYRAIWKHIMNVSVTDLRENYEKLGVDFDLWKGEADVQVYIPDMVQGLKENGHARVDDGALVIDVKEETDTKEIPPCMIQKSDGASLYGTTDLATLVEREELYQPNEVIYIVDKRQELHFTQVFRAAKKTGIVGEDTKLQFLGFGTMNGKDGKPFKTRDGGVMRLENFIGEICDEMYKKIMDNRTVEEKEAQKTANIVGISAIKYGDLSNQIAKDYVFDVERFTSFEGNTGPYILYTIVRIKSILQKSQFDTKMIEKMTMQNALESSEKNLMLEAARWSSIIDKVYEELAPHKLCAYVYDLANAFNRFYHETKILTEEEEMRRQSYIKLLALTKSILETCIALLGFEAPERM
jgi:arginyl-tRNA synthetase